MRNDLSTFTKEELEKFLAKCQAAIKIAAWKEIQLIAAEIKVPVCAIVSCDNVKKIGSRGPRRGVKYGPAPKKFIHPSSGYSWTGRGHEPKWIQEYLDGGGQISDLRVRT